MQQYFNGMSWKDLLLTPMYFYQAKQVKQNTIVLSTPKCDKGGRLEFDNVEEGNSEASLKLLIVGDSAAAGVGVENYQDALLGQLIKFIADDPFFTKNFSQLNWQIAAVSGFTSFDVLRQLYVLPKSAVDVVIINVGVNDVVKNTSIVNWRENLQGIIAIAKRKMTAQHIIFVSVPPMQLMPALPNPLNNFIGKKAALLNDQLQLVISDYQNCQVSKSSQQLHYLEIKFDKSANHALVFAKDGFHPSAQTYTFLAQQLSQFIKAILSNE